MSETTKAEKLGDALAGMIMANAMTVNLLCSKDLLSRDEAVEYFKTMSDALLKNDFPTDLTDVIDLIARLVSFLHLPAHEFAQKMKKLKDDL